MLLESLGALGDGPPGDELTTPTRGHSGLPAYQLREGTVLLQRRPQRRPAAGHATRSAGSPLTGHLPLGYLGDAEKTRQTFPVVDGVRYSVGGDRGALAARRPAALPRPRVDVHQHGRREGVRRGGRAGREEPPGRLRRARRRHAERALGPAGDGRRVAAARAPTAPTRRGAPRALRRRISPTTSCRRPSSRRPRSCAARAASPTTPGPSSSRSTRWAPPAVVTRLVAPGVRIGHKRAR